MFEFLIKIVINEKIPEIRQIIRNLAVFQKHQAEIVILIILANVVWLVLVGGVEIHDN